MQNLAPFGKAFARTAKSNPQIEPPKKHHQADDVFFKGSEPPGQRPGVGPNFLKTDQFPHDHIVKHVFYCMALYNHTELGYF